MKKTTVELLAKLAQARGFRFSVDRLPVSRWLEASDGTRLHFLDWRGGPSTLVLLHGGLLSAHTFDLLALALSEGIGCVALDLRGHGESGWADDYSIGRSAADVLELIDHLGVAEVHLAGMSLGGCVAGHVAPLLGARLKSLSFVDVGDEVNFEASARMRAFIEGVRPAAQVEDIVRQALAVSPKTDPDLMLYRYRSLLTEGPEGYCWKADRRAPVNFPHILGKLAELNTLAPTITCPVLVVKGGNSHVLTQEGLERFASGFPKGRWAVIPGAGHNIQEDQPAALAAAMRDLMAGCAGSSGAMIAPLQKSLQSEIKT
jgi:pimeloyl-ACP methyl ester carboxylesterase